MENKLTHRSTFRFRSFDDGVMVYSDDVSLLKIDKQYHDYLNNVGYDRNVGSFFYRTRKSAFVMEWLGFYSKNNVPVYVGDLCKKGEYTGVIEKDMKSMSYVLKCKKKGEDILIPLSPTLEDTNFYWMADLYIIGNIYEMLPVPIYRFDSACKCEICGEPYRGNYSTKTCSIECHNISHKQELEKKYNKK